MAPSIVLDKNFLQGSSVTDIHALASSHRLIMPGALFYELLTTDAADRRRCFMKLPQIENPVELVDHIGNLLRAETKTQQPSGKPSSHRVELAYRFNSALMDEGYEMPAEAKAAIVEQEAEVARNMIALKGLAECVPNLFPELFTQISNGHRPAILEAEEAIAKLEQIQRFYQQLNPPDPTHRFPTIKGDFALWAHIRWVQVLMLFALNVYARLRGTLTSTLTPQQHTQLEHDIHDAQILALGVLEGAIATKEAKLRRWFVLLEPSGILYPQST